MMTILIPNPRTALGRVNPFRVGSANSCPKGRTSIAIPELPQVGGDGGVELRGFGLLLPQQCGEPLYLLLEWLVILVGRAGAK